MEGALAGCITAEDDGETLNVIADDPGVDLSPIADALVQTLRAEAPAAIESTAPMLEGQLNQLTERLASLGFILDRAGARRVRWGAKPFGIEFSIL